MVNSSDRFLNTWVCRPRVVRRRSCWKSSSKLIFFFGYWISLLRFRISGLA